MLLHILIHLILIRTWGGQTIAILYSLLFILSFSRLYDILFITQWIFNTWLMENKGSYNWKCIAFWLVCISLKYVFSNHPFSFPKKMVAFESILINVGQAICKLFLGFWKEKYLSRTLHACLLSKMRKFFIGNKKVPASCVVIISSPIAFFCHIKSESLPFLLFIFSKIGIS